MKDKRLAANYQQIGNTQYPLKLATWHNEDGTVGYDYWGWGGMDRLPHYLLRTQLKSSFKSMLVLQKEIKE